MRTLLSASWCQEQDTAAEHGDEAESRHDYPFVAAICEPGHSGDGTKGDKSKRNIEQNGFELVKTEVFDDQPAKHTETAARYPVQRSVMSLASS